MRSIPSLSDVSPMLPLKRFQCSSDRRRPSLVLSRKIVWLFLFQRPSPPGDQWYDVLGLLPAGGVSSFSTLQIFREASHLWGLLCPPIVLLSRFPSLRHFQGSTPTGVFEGGCGPLIHSSLGFPFYFSLFVASSLNLLGWWHVWSVTSWGNPAEDTGDCFHLHCSSLMLKRQKACN